MKLLSVGVSFQVKATGSSKTHQTSIMIHHERHFARYWSCQDIWMPSKILSSQFWYHLKTAQSRTLQYITAHAHKNIERNENAGLWRRCQKSVTSLSLAAALHWHYGRNWVLTMSVRLKSDSKTVGVVFRNYFDDLLRTQKLLRHIRKRSRRIQELLVVLSGSCWVGLGFFRACLEWLV